MPVVLTIAVAFVTVALAIVADDNLRGASELVVGGLIAARGALLIVIWLQAFRRRAPPRRPLRDRQDGLPDVRCCPSCNYRMVGLTESRCPECGTVYTLDELIGAEGFAPVASKLPVSPDGGSVHPGPQIGLTMWTSGLAGTGGGVGRSGRGRGTGSPRSSPSAARSPAD